MRSQLHEGIGRDRAMVALPPLHNVDVYGVHSLVGILPIALRSAAVPCDYILTLIIFFQSSFFTLTFELNLREGVCMYPRRLSGQRKAVVTSVCFPSFPPPPV